MSHNIYPATQIVIMTATQPLYNLDKDKIDELYKHGAFFIVDDMPKGRHVIFCSVLLCLVSIV